MTMKTVTLMSILNTLVSEKEEGVRRIRPEFNHYTDMKRKIKIQVGMKFANHNVGFYGGQHHPLIRENVTGHGLTA